MVYNLVSGLKLLGNPLILLCAFVYSLNVFYLQQTFHNGFLKFYLNDLLCMPLVLVATAFLQRTLFRKPAYCLTGVQVGLASVYFSVMFEGFIPLVNARYTADFLDVICYCSGGGLFYIFGNWGNNKLLERA